MLYQDLQSEIDDRRMLNFARGVARELKKADPVRYRDVEEPVLCLGDGMRFLRCGPYALNIEATSPAGVLDGLRGLLVDGVGEHVMSAHMLEQRLGKLEEIWPRSTEALEFLSTHTAGDLIYQDAVRDFFARFPDEDIFCVWYQWAADDGWHASNSGEWADGLELWCATVAGADKLASAIFDERFAKEASELDEGCTFQGHVSVTRAEYGDMDDLIDFALDETGFGRIVIAEHSRVDEPRAERPVRSALESELSEVTRTSEPGFRGEGLKRDAR